ncbi:hypothetical protein PR048_003928 [Dryococelus australis]|uniref:Uncharacterized protein n=1 Tax=Dryococelus australis TaxID=614101 RepID=A0ABQ9IQX7_9NEOP|nr:hypothetical protein PR048_003928 [Dryococelus australis]
MRLIEGSMDQRRNERAGETGNLLKKPTYQRHHPVRFPHAKIWSDPVGDLTQIDLIGAWIAFFESLRNESLLKDGVCPYGRAARKVFSSVCAPGANSPDYDRQNLNNGTDLCGLCGEAIAKLPTPYTNSTDTSMSCVGNSSNPIHGDRGAILCLSTGVANVAFVRINSLQAAIAVRPTLYKLQYLTKPSALSLQAVGTRWCSEVRLIAHEDEPGSIPGGVTPGLTHMIIVLDDKAWRQVFSGICCFPPALHSDTAPCSPCFTLMCSQDLDRDVVAGELGFPADAYRILCRDGTKRSLTATVPHDCALVAVTVCVECCSTEICCCRRAGLHRELGFPADAYRILCRDGTKRSLTATVPDDCGLSSVVGGEIVARRNRSKVMTRDINNLMSELDDWFGYAYRNYENIFHIFEEFKDTDGVLLQVGCLSAGTSVNRTVD